jgi:transcriptional regulator with XRE-family HTH domain
MTTLIRDARMRRGVGVRELARRCGVAAPTVTDWERSEAQGTIGVETLRRALSAIGDELELSTPRAHRSSERLERLEQRLGLELHRAVAQKLVLDPEEVVAHAQSNVERLLTTTRGGARDWVIRWSDLLDRHAIGQLVDVMLGTEPSDINMRSVSPFSGLLTAEERRQVSARAAV